MKRILAIGFSCLMLVLVSGCGKTGENDGNGIVPIEPVQMDDGAGGEESSGGGFAQNEVSGETSGSGSVQDGDSMGTDAEKGNGEGGQTQSQDTGTLPGATEGNESDVPAGNETDMPAETEYDSYVGEYDSTELDTAKLEINEDADGYHIRIDIFRLTTLYDCIGHAADGGIAFSTMEWGEEITGTVTLEGETATVTFTGGWSGYSFGNLDKHQYVKASDVPKMDAPKPEVDLSSYVGEYNDHDNNEPNLEIRRNDDGSYLIQVGVYRLLGLNDCVGYDVGDGIEFSSDGAGRQGMVVLEGNVATVTFSGDSNVYRYYKTSNIPVIQEP